MIKMYKVYGAEGHRQRESFSPSYKVTTFSNVTISVINSDITGTNNYSLIKLEGDNEIKLKDEFEGQLSDGVFENSAYGITEEIKDEEFDKYVNKYIPDIELIYNVKYYKKWKDSTIYKGKVDELTRKEALETIREDLTLAETFTDEEIEIEIRLFDKYHVIDLGDYMITIEGIDEENE